MICPACHSDSPHRSRRKSMMDYTVGLVGLRPWRCRVCESRFLAWAVSVRYVGYAHCGLCGNMDLQRIAGEHGTGTFAWLFSRIGLPAYRCAPCRNRFFSIRSYHRIVPPRHEQDVHTHSGSMAG